MIAANFNETVVSTLPEDLQTGIYFGWTQLEDDSSEVRKAVVSIGWNPYYHNQKKSVVCVMQTNILTRLTKKANQLSDY